MRVYADTGPPRVSLNPAGAAYDAVAPEYDALLAGDAWMRRALHARYLRLFRPGSRVIDVGCGTGTDAIMLARNGVRVVGLDASRGMLEAMRANVARAGLESRIEIREGDIADLGAFPAGSADGMISAFAALSTLPGLESFARDAARLLRPGGRLVVQMLNRLSLWEALGHVARGDFAAAGALARQDERWFTIGGRPVRHRLYFAGDAYACFRRAGFRLGRAYSLGSLRPPHTVRRMPAGLVGALEGLDVRLGGVPPLLNLGRFFVLEMERAASVGGR